MRLKTLLSSKTVARTQIIAAVVSAFSLLIATWISTLQIPNMQHMIDDKDSIIEELRDKTTKDLVQGLYAADVHTDRRIDFLDVRLERIMVSSRSKREELLLQSAINKTIDQIKQWDSLFISKDTHPVLTTLPTFDENTSAEQKIIRLDPTLASARRNAYSRLREIINQIHTHCLQKDKNQSTLKKKQVWFKRFQMFELLSLVLVIALESIIKYNEIDNTYKKRDICEHVAESDRGETAHPQS